MLPSPCRVDPGSAAFFEIMGGVCPTSVGTLKATEIAVEEDEIKRAAGADEVLKKQQLLGNKPPPFQNQLEAVSAAGEDPSITSHSAPPAHAAGGGRFEAAFETSLRLEAGTQVFGAKALKRLESGADS